MKLKLSISMDEETVRVLEESLKEGRFRNKSHAIEFAVRKLLEQKIGDAKGTAKSQKSLNAYLEGDSHG